MGEQGPDQGPATASGEEDRQPAALQPPPNFRMREDPDPDEGWQWATTLG